MTSPDAVTADLPAQACLWDFNAATLYLRSTNGMDFGTDM